MGFRKYRAEAATAAEKRPIRMVTFFVKVDPKNMGKVAILSRRINDANIEMTSIKSAAQEVEAIYGLQDKTQAEMDLILTPEVTVQTTFKDLRDWRKSEASWCTVSSA
jgi:hypothetical protein